MTNRYHFDLEKGHEVIPDRTGVVVDSIEEAHEAAETVIQEMRDSGELSDSAESWVLVIRDQGGVELKRISI